MNCQEILKDARSFESRKTPHYLRTKISLVLIENTAFSFTFDMYSLITVNYKLTRTSK